MNQRKTRQPRSAQSRLGSWSAAVVLACTGLMSTSPAYAQPSVIRVPGIVRDFKKSHSDFDVIPSGGYGHYAGNIALSLNAAQRPTLVGGGFHVDAQWMDLLSQPIAPHMYRASGSNVVSLVSSPTINNNPTIDTFNSGMGPYGGSNVGPAPTIETGWRRNVRAIGGRSTRW